MRQSRPTRPFFAAECPGTTIFGFDIIYLGWTAAIGRQTPQPSRGRNPAMHRSAYLFLLLTTLLWGGNSVAGKLAVDHISPMTLVFLRWVLAVADPAADRLAHAARGLADGAQALARAGGARRQRLHLVQHHLLHGAQLHDGDQRLDRTGGDTGPDHHRQFPLVPLARELGADRRRRADHSRRGR